MRYVVVAAVLVVLAGCGNGSGDEGGGSASCADSVMFAGIEYLGTMTPAAQEAGSSGTPVLGEALGTGERVACDDGGSEAGVIHEGGNGTAYSLEGVDERWVIAFGDDAADARVYVVNGNIPKDVQATLAAWN